MIATYRNRRFQLAALNEFINGFTHLCALAIPEPADTCRQPLEANAVTCKSQPTIQCLVLGEKLKREVVGLANILSVPGERYPAERPFSLAKKRANIFRH